MRDIREAGHWRRRLTKGACLALLCWASKRSGSGGAAEGVGGELRRGVDNRGRQGLPGDNDIRGNRRGGADKNGLYEDPEPEAFVNAEVSGPLRIVAIDWLMGRFLGGDVSSAGVVDEEVGGVVIPVVELGGKKKKVARQQ